MSAADRIERLCAAELDDRALRATVLAELDRVVGFDAYAWLLTDPQTCVGSSPLAEVPSLGDLPSLIRLKYLTTTNRWTSLSAGAPATLLGTTRGDPGQSRVWTELLSTYGIVDVLSVTFADAYGCWAFLDLWRSSTPFSTAECALVGSVAGIVTAGLRHSLLATFAATGPVVDAVRGPAVLLLGDDLRLLAQTAQSDAHLRALLPTDADRAPVPAGAYNVCAQLLAVESGVDQHPPSASVHLGGGRWMTLRADRIAGTEPTGSREVAAASIAVSIEPTPSADRAALYARVAGLSTREAELVGHLVSGGDTSEVAARMFISQHTVQDHLKSIFAKTGVNSRRQLLARATGAGYT